MAAWGGAFKNGGRGADAGIRREAEEATTRACVVQTDRKLSARDSARVFLVRVRG